MLSKEAFVKRVKHTTEIPEAEASESNVMECEELLMVRTPNSIQRKLLLNHQDKQENNPADAHNLNVSVYYSHGRS